MTKFTEIQLREAAGKSTTFAETLRQLGMCETGGNYITLKKYLTLWKVSINHFSTASERARKYLTRLPKPIDSILVSLSFHNRTDLKKRLYKEKLKKPVCEMCGQTEMWRGRKISLILDHKNGIRHDNRLVNLRILCPNCNATLDTHCGKQIKNKCAGCSNLKPIKRKYCSMNCYRKYGTQRLMPKLRKVKRPDYEILTKEIKSSGFSAVARKYGVSDNAIRKWVRVYQKYGK